MSLVAPAPGFVPVPKKVRVKADEAVFIAQHEQSVRADVVYVARLLECGESYELRVTPEWIAIRHPKAAKARVDLASAGCDEARSLRKLFRKCATSEDLEVEFPHKETLQKINIGGEKEVIYMMRVQFTKKCGHRKGRPTH